MNQEVEKNLKMQIEKNCKTYITVEELEAKIDEKVEYIELANIIKSFIHDGILKPIRKKQKWQNAITFFEI